jgi:hypothetical protein
MTTTIRCRSEPTLLLSERYIVHITSNQHSICSELPDGTFIIKQTDHSVLQYASDDERTCFKIASGFRHQHSKTSLCRNHEGPAHLSMRPWFHPAPAQGQVLIVARSIQASTTSGRKGSFSCRCKMVQVLIDPRGIVICVIEQLSGMIEQHVRRREQTLLLSVKYIVHFTSNQHSFALTARRYFHHQANSLHNSHAKNGPISKLPLSLVIQIFKDKSTGFGRCIGIANIQHICQCVLGVIQFRHETQGQVLIVPRSIQASTTTGRNDSVGCRC